MDRIRSKSTNDRLICEFESIFLIYDIEIVACILVDNKSKFSEIALSCGQKDRATSNVFCNVKL